MNGRFGGGLLLSMLMSVVVSSMALYSLMLGLGRGF